MIRKFFATIIVAFMVLGLNAQKLKTVEGSPKVIKGDKNIAVVFTYDNLKVGKMEEVDYIKREIAERDEKEPGTGEMWAEEWKNDKQDRYPEKFIELFNKIGGELFDAKIVPGSSNSKYTMKVNTSWIEPGFNVGVMRKPALTNQEIEIYETSNPDKIVHKFTILKSPGTGAAGYDFDAGFRIRESFAKAAKEYAKFIYKKHIK